MKPVAPSVNITGIPDALKVERRWLLWRYIWIQHDGRAGRWSKPPFQTSGQAAKANEAATWMAFDDVFAAYRSGHFDGVGFRLGDGWAGLDLDHCDQRANVMLHQMADCYVKTSPSGTGYKAIRARR